MASTLSSAVSTFKCGGVCLLCLLIQLSCSQPPPPAPPRLSNSFSSKVSVLDTLGISQTYHLYANYELKKSLKISSIGTDGAVGNTYGLTIGNTSYQYIEPFDYCAIDPYGDAFTPMWTWVLNATYREGVFEFMGKLVGVWTYKDKTSRVTKEAAFLAPDFKTPVYMLSSTDDGLTVFEDYDDSSPPPSSRFTLPKMCEKKALSAKKLL